MHTPSLTTPEGAFDYLMILIGGATLFFGAIFAAIYYGIL